MKIEKCQCENVFPVTILHEKIQEFLSIYMFDTLRHAALSYSRILPISVGLI